LAAHDRRAADRYADKEVRLPSILGVGFAILSQRMRPLSPWCCSGRRSRSGPVSACPS